MKLIALACLTLLGTAHAYEARVKKGELSPSLEALITKASGETQLNFKASDFMLIEERELATSRYQFYVQTNSMVPVAKTAIRIWSDLKTNELIYAEMHLSESTKKNEVKLAQKYKQTKFSPKAMKSNQLSNAINSMVAAAVREHGTDNKVLGMKSKDLWLNGELVREVEVRGRRGVHVLTISLLKNRILEKTYREFPQSENVTLKAHVYPIYEEVEATGERLQSEVRELKYIDTHVHDAGKNPLSGLGNVRFEEKKYNTLLAGTIVGDFLGLWSEASLRHQVEEVTSKLPVKENSFQNGLLLQGKYATINLHPAVKEQFKDVAIPLNPTVNHMLSWVDFGDNNWGVIPSPGLTGKLIYSQEELLTRVPVRLPDHDPTKYINSGVDEVQVYYGVTTLMDTLVDMGFNDKELSEKPFHAFLYDPDIGMKDNAYYYDNTINFTTYSPGAPNYARDNPTIWHELGHAIMERLMGVHLGFADSKGGYGGLSEGMADFVAQIVVQAEMKGQDFTGADTFRIINETGFYLTNEFHDEGEAYGGAMNDMMKVVMAEEGEVGLRAFAELTIEAMRLTRNHPALSAQSWFEHMLIADELGSAVRAPGKYKDIIINSLMARNFSFSKDFESAKMTVRFNAPREKSDIELTSASAASRDNPIRVCKTEGSVNYDLQMQLSPGDADFIEFPALVKVEYKKGALQGAVKWVGEETNPQTYTIHTPEDVLSIPLQASMECDFVNQPDGSCKDYAYLQVFNPSSSKPVAKKRFYLQLKNKDCEAKK